MLVDEEIPAAATSDVTVAAPASDLFLLLWNRVAPDPATVDGDPTSLEVWRETVRVRWSE